MKGLMGLLSAALLFPALVEGRGPNGSLRSSRDREATRNAAAIQESTSPYSGLESRGLKALSDEEVRGYLEAEGMGLARPAELNHYPGPKHVLERASELAMTEAQVVRTRAVYQAMHAEAVRGGKKLIDAERRLEAFFTEGGTDPARLEAVVNRAAAALGELRTTHLKAHLKMRTILTQEQVARYDALRGYDPRSGHTRPHHDHR